MEKNEIEHIKKVNEKLKIYLKKKFDLELHGEETIGKFFFRDEDSITLIQLKDILAILDKYLEVYNYKIDYTDESLEIILYIDSFYFEE